MVNPLSEINRMRRGMAGVDEEVSNIIGKGLTKRLTNDNGKEKVNRHQKAA